RFDFFPRRDGAGGIVGIDDIYEPGRCARAVEHDAEIMFVALVQRNVCDFAACALREFAERGKSRRACTSFLPDPRKAAAAMHRISPEPQPSTICSCLTLCKAASLSVSVSYSVRG